MVRGAGGIVTLAPMAVRGLRPALGQRRSPGHGRRRQHRLWCRSRRASGRAPRGGRAARSSPPYAGPRRLGVRPDHRPVEQRQAELDAAGLQQPQQALPGTKPGQRMNSWAARHHDRQRRSSVPQGGSRQAAPEGPELRRQRAPRRAVAVPPDDAVQRPPQVAWRPLAPRTAGLDQGYKRRSRRIRHRHRPTSRLPRAKRPTHRSAQSPRPCSITSPSRGGDPLEAHPGREQGGEHGHAARGLAARLVVDPKASVALEAAQGLLRLPAPLRERKAPAAWGASYDWIWWLRQAAAYPR
jgi:hypothetical protein